MALVILLQGGYIVYVNEEKDLESFPYNNNTTDEI